MEFRLLGAVEMLSDGRVLDAGPSQQRRVVAALAVDAGQPVITETLIDRVWDEAPTGARRTLHVQLTRIRRLLESDGGGRCPARLVRRSGGYLLDVDQDQVDVHRFRRLVTRARDPELTDGERAVLLRDALSLWRGQPLAGLPGEWAGRVREAWRQEFLGAVVAWADAELAVGDPDTVAARLSELAAEHPLEESLTAALMRSLAAVGRTAEALDHYLRIQRRLADELGTDPGLQLQQVHRAILRGAVDARPDPARTRRWTPPGQLPADLYGFAGRGDELARLDAVLGDGRHTAVPICCLSGMAGVGKTSLAVHWAHRVADRFPDGQLYVNLRGFGPAGAPLNPGEALRRFLDALDFPAQQIPADLDGQVALYRSQLAGRRMLVLLDNARDVEQVRPLLPGSPGNLVVVTSRDQLSGLVAAEGAVPLPLDPLAPGEAHDMLASRLGVPRVAAESHAAEQIATLCGRLPLALAIAAARAAIHPHFSLAAMAGELRDALRRLDLLASGHHATDVRAAFAWSYDALHPTAARLFRLLAVHGGPDITVPAAASLAGAPVHAVHPLLAELARAHLLIEDSPGRYSLHDLLRLYAGELVRTHDSDSDRRDALHRVLDHYLHTAHAAALLLNPHRQPLAITDRARPGVTAEELDGQPHALAWFVAERATLLAAIRRAADEGYHAHTWQLAWTLMDFFHRQGHWPDQLAGQDIALAAARRMSDRSAQAESHRCLGRTYARLGRLDDARAQLLEALNLFADLRDQAGQGHIHRELSVVLEREERYQEALDQSRQALELFRGAGHQAGEASSLNGIGWYLALQGDYPQATTFCEQALVLFQRIGSRALEGATWDSLGYAHHHLGDHPEAIRCYQRSLTLLREAGERYYEAEILGHIATSYDAVGDHASARDALQRSLVILDELGHSDADEIRARLAGAPSGGPARQLTLPGRGADSGTGS